MPKQLAPEGPSEISEIFPLAMVQCDPTGNVRFMNRACRELLDRLHIPRVELVRILPDRYKSMVRKALSDKQIHETGRVYEACSLHFVLKASEDGSYVYIFIRDVTAQEEAKAQLIQSEKMASLGLLIAGLAHEINTPLGAICSNNDILSRSVGKLRQMLEQAPGAIRIMNIVEEVCQNNTLATERLMSIVGGLKNFARLDEAELKRVDVHEGLDSTLTIVQHQLRNRIRVEKQYGDLPPVECHPNRLNQVFMNLLINAAQAISDRGTITIKTWTEAGAVKISVSDDGIGIPPENVSKVFDPGFTTKGVGVGTGLGLSICYKIIQEHEGRIEVESSEKGSTFTITLPLERTSEVIHA